MTRRTLGVLAVVVVVAAATAGWLVAHRLAADAGEAAGRR